MCVHDFISNYDTNHQLSIVIQKPISTELRNCHKNHVIGLETCYNWGLFKFNYEKLVIQ